jgi:hypothetical protein
MALSPAQLPTLKAAILAETDAGFVADRTASNTPAMAKFYNVDASPNFYVWRSNYSVDQIAAGIEGGITQLDGLTASKREVLLWWAERSHDMRSAASQAAVDDMTGSQNTLKASVLDGGKRKVKRGEKLFTTGTGSLAVPGAAPYEGDISENDVVAALQLP